MGYLDNITGYRDDLLTNRATAKHGNPTLSAPDGLVKNIIPGSENCDATILSTPELGASSADYLVTPYRNGGNQQGFGGEGIEAFLYVISGDITAKAEGEIFALNEGGYPYHPPGSLMTFVNVQAEDSQIFLYKRRYTPVEGHAPWLVPGNANELKRIHYESMDGVAPLDFLPKELGFDMNVYILSFVLGASHGYIEAHVQEHGAYILSGQGVCDPDNNWIPVKKGDYIFTSTCSLQASYGVGRGGAFSYIYSKDCNRNVEV